MNLAELGLSQRTQKIPRPEIWLPPQAPETLSLNEKASEILLDLSLDITPVLYEMADRGYGRKSTGKETSGRESEDVVITIDNTAEELAKKSLLKSAKKYNVSFFVLSEHQYFMAGHGEPQLFLTMDPHDNSDEFEKREGDVPGFFVASFWDRQGNHCGATQSNLLTKHIFYNRDRGIYEYNPRIRKLEVFPETPIVESIKDQEFIIITYDGKDKYFRRFNENLDELNLDRNPLSSLHGKAGAHGACYQTWNGGVYAIFNEPLSEIPPGLPFALSRDFKPYNIDEFGVMQEYKFDPLYYYQTPERYYIDRIGFWVLSPSLPIANEIVEYASTKKLPGWKEIEKNLVKAA